MAIQTTIPAPTVRFYESKIDSAMDPDPRTDVALFNNLILSGYEDSVTRVITNRAVATGQVANTNMTADKPNRDLLAMKVIGAKPKRDEFPPRPAADAAYTQAISAWKQAKRRITEPDPRAGNVSPDPDMLWYLILGYGTYKFARDASEGGYSAEDLGKIGTSSSADLLLLAPVAGAGFRAERSALAPGPKASGRLAGTSQLLYLKCSTSSRELTPPRTSRVFLPPLVSHFCWLPTLLATSKSGTLGDLRGQWSD